LQAAVKKEGVEAEAVKSRIRITLSSTNVANLEKGEDLD
jgi:hypothetical protein